MIDPMQSRRILVERDKTSVVAALSACLGLAIAGVIFVPGQVEKFQIPTLLYYTFSCVALAFASALCTAMIIDLFDSRPAVVLDDEGLWSRSISTDVIPWEAIRDAKYDEQGRVVILQIDPGFCQIMRQSFFQKMANVWNSFYGGSRYQIPFAFNDYPGADFCQMIVSRIEENRT